MLVLSIEARAWGTEGHRVIAAAALPLLSPSAKAQVDRLLALEPGATLVSISTWADDSRTPATAKWHYVNLARDSGCRYDARRDCAEGACVVGAIERQAAVLASNAPDDVRLDALKYVVHFVADVHQPLHAGFADDRGGNSTQLQAFGRGTNLHALWDTGLIEQWPGGPNALLAEVQATNASIDIAVTPASWAEESCRIVSAEGFYPSGHKLDSDYARQWDATLVERMAAAARRTAAVLNQSLSGR